MAKYRLRNSNNVVRCEVLNESKNEFVVRFNNGVIQKVPKYRVSNLDRIDEGVLDAVRGAADSVNKYGRKFVSKIKDTAKKIKEFLIKALVVDGFVVFKDSENGYLEASHPVNAIEGAKNTDCVNYVPGTDTIELCNEIGIEPEAIENYEFNDEYDGSLDFVCSTNESTEHSSSILKALFEDENTRLKDNEKIKLTGTFTDWNEEEIVNYILGEYSSRRRGRNPSSDPLMIWGAPGIGKTAIIRSLVDIIEQKTGKKINFISVNGGNVGPDDFTMPASVERTLNTNNIDQIEDKGFKGASRIVIEDLPKSWLPVYNPKTEGGDAEALNAVANGGKVVKGEDGSETIENGPGGIFFIDEYSRMTQAGMDALMQTPTTREIGSNSTLTFGDRWVIVCAANRKSDMSRAGRSEALSWEGASKTRFHHINFVPDPKVWIKWAREDNKYRPGYKNVIPEIIQYIESEIKRDPVEYGDYYEMWSHPQGELNGEKATACPRQWRALSEEIIDQYLDNEFIKAGTYNSVADIPVNKIIKLAAGLVGLDVAKRFATFVSKYSLFTPTDAANVWKKGTDVKYDILDKNVLNSANVEKYFTEHIFPVLKRNYPGGLDKGVSAEAALNAIKFIEACCYDNGSFNLNRFNTICAAFELDFGVNLTSLTGPYAEVANYKENVVSSNELV